MDKLFSSKTQPLSLHTSYLHGGFKFHGGSPYENFTAPEICNTIMDHFMGYFGTPPSVLPGPAWNVTNYV